ncbi:MAG: hypothetical protein BGO39_16615 [Chloroflexi bacterium 54-19]|nr:MAG: hypothetical protein BGO39_16615 [Chloroflexi bacterium 54-19]
MIASAIIALFQEPFPALANGGTPIYNGDIGSFNVYLLISPSPPTPVVPAHLTMVITRKSSDDPVTEAVVTVDPVLLATPVSGATRLKFYQTPGRPNQYDVDIPVATEGDWRFDIIIDDPKLGVVSFNAQTRVEKSDPPWPVIIALVIALPLLAGLTWFFLFRESADLEFEDEEDEDD